MHNSSYGQVEVKIDFYEVWPGNLKLLIQDQSAIHFFWYLLCLVPL